MCFVRGRVPAKIFSQCPAMNAKNTFNRLKQKSSINYLDSSTAKEIAKGRKVSADGGVVFSVCRADTPHRKQKNI